MCWQSAHSLKLFIYLININYTHPLTTITFIISNDKGQPWYDLFSLFFSGGPLYYCFCCLWRPRLAYLCQVMKWERDKREGDKDKRGGWSSCSTLPASGYIRKCNFPSFTPKASLSVEDAWCSSSGLLPSPNFRKSAHWLPFWSGSPTSC